MPRHLISDTHEWIQMVPTVAILLKREVMDGIVGWRVCSSSLLTTSLLQATSYDGEEGDDGEGDGGANQDDKGVPSSSCKHTLVHPKLCSPI